MTRASIPELDDLDRYNGQVVTDEDFTRMAQRFDALVYARVLAERRAEQARLEAVKQRDFRRGLWRLTIGWGVGCLAVALLALYLRSIGE